MDLTAAAVGFQQAKVTTEIQFKIARKILDAQQQNGAGAIQLLEAASSGIEKAGSQLSAAATGLGGEVDTQA